MLILFLLFNFIYDLLNEPHPFDIAMITRPPYLFLKIYVKTPKFSGTEKVKAIGNLESFKSILDGAPM